MTILFDVDIIAAVQEISVPVAGTLLAMTMERVTTKGRIMGLMKSRSTTGREGTTVCKCAGLGETAYHRLRFLRGKANRAIPTAVNIQSRTGRCVWFLENGDIGLSLVLKTSRTV